ncbi:MAG TPA: hypothetical protein PKW35_21945, partial [Nannocystaceae bacterium]|nr:hypothetical protein [Nannocystaceae bacterium]
MNALSLASLTSWIALVAAAGWIRGRFLALLFAVVLGLHTLAAIALVDAFAGLWPLWIGLQVATYGHFLALVRPRMRPWPWRALVAV